MNFSSDLKYALRALRLNPGFAVTAVLTLALGIGANTAIFSLVDGYLLRPLPYKNPDRLVVLWESTQEGGRGAVAMANYQDWLRQATAFEKLAAWSPMQVDLKIAGRSERVQGELATPSYLSLLGVAPQLGRDFNAEEDTPHPVVIVSDSFWRSRMGASADAVGRNLVLGGALFTVIGVMPPGFAGLSGEATIWTPIADYNLMYPQLAAFDFPHSRDVHFMRGLGRLKAGVSVEAAGAEMKIIGERLAAQYPNENRNRGIALAPAQNDLTRDLSPKLGALFTAVGLVLLVACANVANLVLVRLSRRQREIAVRIALGARRWHLLRQLWSETAVISVAGAALGLALLLTIRGSWNKLLPLDLPKFAETHLDLRLALFALAITILTGAVLAVFPILQLTHGGMQPRLGSSARAGDSPLISKTRTVLAAAEVALAVVLTTGAGLMIRSLWRLEHNPPGFRADHLLTLRFDVPANKYPGEARYSLAERVAEQIQTLPGIESTAATSADLLVWPGLNRGFEVEGHEPYRNQFSVYYEDITPGYFRTLGIPLLAGRDFTAADNLHSTPVMIVSQAFARRYLPGQDPIGKRLRIGGPKAAWRVIVGVAGDAQMEDLHHDKADISIFYSPMRNAEVIESLSLVVRTAISPVELLPSVHAELERFDPDFTIYSAATAQERIVQGMSGTRSFTALMAMFGMVAVGLSLLGTYGVIAYSVSQRMREIGIRLALGAQPADIVRLITVQGAGIVMVGLGAGLAASLGLTRFLDFMLFRVETRDPLVLSAITALVGFAAIAACYLPARRAARANTIVALRQE